MSVAIRCTLAVGLELTSQLVAATDEGRTPSCRAVGPAFTISEDVVHPRGGHLLFDGATGFYTWRANSGKGQGPIATITKIRFELDKKDRAYGTVTIYLKKEHSLSAESSASVDFISPSCWTEFLDFIRKYRPPSVLEY